MEKQLILHNINENYNSFIDYLSSLSKEEFEFSNNQKW